MRTIGPIDWAIILTIWPIDWAIILWSLVGRGLLAGIVGPKPMVPTSRSTMAAVVIEGEGYFEMACPHLSGDQHQ